MEREERRFIEEGKAQRRSSLPGIRQSGRAPCPQFGQMAAKTETSTGKRAIFEPCAWSLLVSVQTYYKPEDERGKAATKVAQVSNLLFRRASSLRAFRVIV